MMTRRSFTQVCVAGLAALGHRTPSTRYGAIDVARHRQLRARGIDLSIIERATGRDLTPDCFFADDTGEGCAWIFTRTADGRMVIDPMTEGAASARIDGVVFTQRSTHVRH